MVEVKRGFYSYFMILSLFALAIFSLHSFSLTGRVVDSQCRDSDSSVVSLTPEENSYYLKGNTTGLSSSGDGSFVDKEDYCTTKDGYPVLAEMHCSALYNPARVIGTSVSCRFGCKNGVCCSDTDCSNDPKKASNTVIIDSSTPIISLLSPSSSVSSSRIDLEIQTNENSVCKYSLNDVDFNFMTDFSLTGGNSHKTLFEGLLEGNYTYFVNCKDSYGNIGESRVSFIVDLPDSDFSRQDYSSTIPSPPPVSSFPESDSSLKFKKIGANIFVYESEDDLSTSFYGSVGQGKGYLAMKDFYAENSDDYDFISLYNNFGEHTQYHLAVKNDVRGTGQGLKDDTSSYGSSGRLRGVGYLGNINSYSDYPEDFRPYSGLLEETFVHSFGVFVGTSQDSDSRIEDLPLENPYSGAHWSPCFSIPKGKFSGYPHWKSYELEDNRDGTYSPVPQDSTKPLKFDPWFLYLAGLLPADKVPEATLLIPESGNVRDCLDSDRFRATPIKFNINQVIEKYGSRAPSYPNSQKEFNFAFILVVKPGTEPTQEQIGKLDRYSRNINLVLNEAANLDSTRRVSLQSTSSLPRFNIDLEEDEHAFSIKPDGSSSSVSENSEKGAVEKVEQNSGIISSAINFVRSLFGFG